MATIDVNWTIVKVVDGPKWLWLNNLFSVIMLGPALHFVLGRSNQ